MLQTIAELPDETLRGGLDHLQATAFLYETGLHPDPEYAFKQVAALHTGWALHDRGAY